MNTLAIKPFIGDKHFYKTALLVMIPVIIQQLINTLFNVVDNFMVGQLSGLSMAAVTVANKPALIYNGFFFGITGAGGLMLSQYYGADDYRQCQSIFSLEMILGFCCATVFCAIMILFPEQVMRIFVDDPGTIAIGVSYLRIVSWSYLPAAISSTCIFSMRSLGFNRAPMYISISAIGMNAFFNYCFIFGKLGMPEMGVQGAALGTLMARGIEMLFYMAILLTRKAFFSLDFTKVMQIKKSVLKAFLRKALPLTLNELLWTGGMSVYFWAYAKISEPLLPAITIADLVVQIGYVISMGMASAVAVLIGTRLGAGELKQAKQNAKKLLGLVCGLALISTVLAVGMSFFLPQIFNVDDAMKLTARNLSWIGAMFYLPNAIYAFCFFLLRAGGDTKNAAILDSGYMWLLPVPAAIIMAVFFKGRIGLPAAMLIVNVLMNAKFILALWVVKRGSWVRNITQET